MSKLTYPFRFFWEFLCRLWAWLPILWKDADYDALYLFDIMALKLKRVRAHLLQHNIIEDNALNKISADITTVVDALERLRANRYVEADYEELHQKYSLDWAKSINNYPPEYGVRIKEIWEKEQKLTEADLKTVFDGLQTHIYDWWD